MGTIVKALIDLAINSVNDECGFALLGDAPQYMYGMNPTALGMLVGSVVYPAPGLSNSSGFDAPNAVASSYASAAINMAIERTSCPKRLSLIHELKSTIEDRGASHSIISAVVISLMLYDDTRVVAGFSRFVQSYKDCGTIPFLVVSDMVHQHTVPATGMTGADAASLSSIMTSASHPAALDVTFEVSDGRKFKLFTILRARGDTDWAMVNGFGNGLNAGALQRIPVPTGVKTIQAFANGLFRDSTLHAGAFDPPYGGLSFGVNARGDLDDISAIPLPHVYDIPPFIADFAAEVGGVIRNNVIAIPIDRVTEFEANSAGPCWDSTIAAIVSHDQELPTRFDSMMFKSAIGTLCSVVGGSAEFGHLYGRDNSFFHLYSRATGQSFDSVCSQYASFYSDCSPADDSWLTRIFALIHYLLPARLINPRTMAMPYQLTNLVFGVQCFVFDLHRRSFTSLGGKIAVAVPIEVVIAADNCMIVVPSDIGDLAVILKTPAPRPVASAAQPALADATPAAAPPEDRSDTILSLRSKLAVKAPKDLSILTMVNSPDIDSSPARRIVESLPAMPDEEVQPSLDVLYALIGSVFRVSASLGLTEHALMAIWHLWVALEGAFGPNPDRFRDLTEAFKRVSVRGVEGVSCTLAQSDFYKVGEVKFTPIRMMASHIRAILSELTRDDRPPTSPRYSTATSLEASRSYNATIRGRLSERPRYQEIADLTRTWMSSAPLEARPVPQIIIRDRVRAGAGGPDPRPERVQRGRGY